MSTAARKQRKRAGVKFVRTPKVGTPLAERQGMTEQDYFNWRHRWSYLGHPAMQPLATKPLLERILATTGRLFGRAAG